MERGNTIRLPVLVVMAALGLTTISAVAGDNSTDTSASDIPKHVCSRQALPCRPGIMLPTWEPIDNISTMDRAARAFVYLLALVYLFLGVSIIADRFMSAIEVITSSERTITHYRWAIHSLQVSYSHSQLLQRHRSVVPLHCFIVGNSTVQ